MAEHRVMSGALLCMTHYRSRGCYESHAERRHIADLHFAVPAGADESAPVGAEGDAVDLRPVGETADQGDHLRAPGGEVQPDRAVEVGRLWWGHLQGAGHPEQAQ